MRSRIDRVAGDPHRHASELASRRWRVEVDAMMPHEGAVNFSQHCLALMVVAAAALRSVFVRSAGLNALALAASINAALVRCIEKSWGEEAAQLEHALC